ncbi:MAG: ABC transporter permease [Armatimonadota bacterium]|nr:ABC transporter permease [Armatimonadota bacterium]MDR7469153.1 ABC transporter permease [Armatimonadota bacterium]MDR7474576.1 ABC transporter permease [Armatimonadota bacterium]MDR7538720.1 ABC transporter permease [Armatimonadota bacterium]
MHGYLRRRALLGFITVLGVSVGVFLMIHLVPGDPVLVMLSEFASPADQQALRQQLGLDRPLYIQYWRYLSGALRGDLGRSVRSNRPVVSEIAWRLPNTLRLAVVATLLAAASGGLVGVASAVRRNTLWDHATMLAVLAGLSMPSFWLGLMLMIIFAVRLEWLPVAGYEGWQYVILPGLTLAAGPAAVLARLTRSSMLEVLNQDFVRTARAKGLREQTVVVKHALKNSLIPVVTVLGLQFGHLLGGAVITESVFAWPGVGRLVVEAILARDFPVVQGTVLVIALGFVLVNLIVDVLYAYLDPRIRLT